MTTGVENLQKKINYYFKDKNLLNQALTHSSYVNENNLRVIDSNERLEFLGDAVLGLIVGEYYYNRYPNEKEGELSKLRSASVNEHVLSIVAKKISLGDLIYFGKGEIKNNGKERESILADAFEALIGALFKDSNLEKTREVLYKLFDDIFNDIYSLDRDFKTKLQEVVQKNSSCIVYELMEEFGPDNDKTFYSRVLISGDEYGRGMGKTKKKSEQLAAMKALIKLGEINV